MLLNRELKRQICQSTINPTTEAEKNPIATIRSSKKRDSAGPYTIIYTSSAKWTSH